MTTKKLHTVHIRFNENSETVHMNQETIDSLVLDWSLENHTVTEYACYACHWRDGDNDEPHIIWVSAQIHLRPDTIDHVLVREIDE